MSTWCPDRLAPLDRHFFAADRPLRALAGTGAEGPAGGPVAGRAVGIAGPVPGGPRRPSGQRGDPRGTAGRIGPADCGRGRGPGLGRRGTLRAFFVRPFRIGIWRAPNSTGRSNTFRRELPATRAAAGPICTTTTSAAGCKPARGPPGGDRQRRCDSRDRPIPRRGRAGGNGRRHAG